jgi:cation-transporting ATPase I
VIISGLAGAVAKIAGTVLAAPSPARRVWGTEDRLHLEVRGIHRPAAVDAAEAVRHRLLDLDGVRSVALNGHWGRAVVSYDPDVTDQREIVAAVAEVEQDHELSGQAPASASHPANPGPGVRELAALALSVAGAGYAVAGRVLPVPALPASWPVLLSLVDSTPRLRAVVENRLGRPAADALFALGGAAGQALARRPVALLTEAGYRLFLRHEITARRQSWQTWEHAVANRAEVHEAEPMDYSPRPVPIPAGPVEKLADVSAGLTLAGSGAMLATTRDPGRATAVLAAGVPRAAKVGREAFAAHLAAGLSQAGSLVLEPDVLRRLDRVDTVVLDAATVLTGKSTIDTIVPLGTVDEAELFQRSHDLVDLRHPRTPRRREDWSVTPAAKAPDELRSRVAELDTPDAVVLVVSRETTPVGLVRLLPELDPMAEALVEAARRAGSVLLAGHPALANRLAVDGEVAAGQLGGEVRRLQREGRVVALVTSRDRDALAAADLGIGLRTRGGRLPWGADIACPDVSQACLLLSAATIARQTSTDVTRLSLGGSVVGALLGTLGPATGAAARASVPVHLTAVLALAVGTWRGVAARSRSAPLPVDRTPWHEMSPRAVLNLLASSREGLTDAESVRRHGRTGAPEEVAETGLARASAEELANPLTPALAAGAGISASVGSVSDAALITGVLGLNALIGGAQRVGAGRELRRLLDTSSIRVRLRRAGLLRDARTAELTPGDVVELRAGDAVPADCRLLDTTGVEVDESSLTGESQLVTKSVPGTTAAAIADRHSMLYQGTVVASGRAVAVVVATGDHTEAGRGVHGAGQAPKTGVEARLSTLSSRTLPVAFGAGAVLMGVDLLRGRGINQSLGQAVSLAVAAVPEGLPFVATVAELASARRLSQQGVLVRSPSTIEALGRVDVLCFDKTGTLTEGRIRLRQVSDGRTEQAVSELTPPLLAVLAAALGASPWHEGEGEVPHPTDRAVLDAGREVGLVPGDGLEWVGEIAFEPARGYHATLARRGYELLLSVKGAPEVLLERCVRWQDRPFGESAHDEVAGEVERLARQGFRVLAVAERTARDPGDLEDERVQRLEFRGLLALADPVRSTAAAAVTRLRNAGVEVVMVTGDHPTTAAAIAAELDLIDGRRVVTGAELDAFDDDELSQVLPQAGVFARVSPTQKARLVRLLGATGRIAAMTGDGANDAPAIRLAHVGIALGTRATPAAREAADLIVTDDRIETITGALVEGRAMWSSVRDAVGILLGGNLGEIVFTLLSGVLGRGDVLNARQLLLVNLLTDVLPAMAVAVRPPPQVTADELLAEGPEASLGGLLVHDVYRRAAITAGAAGAGWLAARPVSTPRQAATTALVALVGGQLAQTVAVRGRTPLVVAAGLGSLLALVTVVQVPGLSQFFGCRPLLPHQWALAATAATAAGIAELLWHSR